MALVQLKPGLTCAEVAERLRISFKDCLASDRAPGARRAGGRSAPLFVTQQSFDRYLERVATEPRLKQQRNG